MPANKSTPKPKVTPKSSNKVAPSQSGRYIQYQITPPATGKSPPPSPKK